MVDKPENTSEDTKANSPAKTPVPIELTLKRFSAAWCPSCRAMKLRRTLEDFLEKHPEIEFIAHDDLDNNEIDDEEADEFGVRTIPAFVWLDADGRFLLKREEAMSPTAVEKMYKEALCAAGDTESCPRPRRRVRK